MAERALYPIQREHLETLTGPLGIWQHADRSRPREEFGYCTDDVARSLTVDLMHGAELGWIAVRESAWRSLRFLGAAFVPGTGRFRNFRAADGSWLEAAGSDDCQGRAVRALGLALADSPEPAFAAESRTLFQAALAATRELTSLRGTASAVLGCVAALDREPSAQTHDALADLGSRLKGAFAIHAGDGEWPWPDDRLTYENGLLSEALICGGAELDDADMLRLGLSTLDWLVRVQKSTAGFLPIGSDGWWPRNGIRAQFDQQPIEATSMILAAAAAFDQTGKERYRMSVESAYGWFLGDNLVGVRVADPATGGCHDGLTPHGVNLNHGAESTLMWQVALERVRAIRRTASLPNSGTEPAAEPEMAEACS